MNHLAADTLEVQIDGFFNQFTEKFPEPKTVFDADWPSTCEVGNHWIDPDGVLQIRWQPVRRILPYLDFNNLENALEHEIHPAIKTHYGRHWSANITAHTGDGDLTLLYLWSEADIDRLIENLVGHAVACRNNNTPFSVFFAVTEPDSNYFLTINNETGQVQLESPAKKPLKTIAANLATFMADLKPGWQDE